MIGDVVLGGVFVPRLLLLGIVALFVTGAASRLLVLTGAYRVFAYRPLVDLSLFAIMLGLLLWLGAFLGLTP